MSDKTTLEVIAPSVEEALKQGLEELGLTAADVSVEVLDSGGKGFLGLGKRQVRIRLTVNDGSESLPPKQVEDASDPNADPKPAPVKKKSPRPKEKSANAESPIETTEKDDDHLLEFTQTVVTKLLDFMHLNAQATTRYDDPDRDGKKSVFVEITGDELGVLIGRRGKTINAFQRIAALIVSKEMERWVRVSIDVEGHRSRREKQLQHMAQKMAQQAITRGRSQSLEPMPASERRIVHMSLQDNHKVTTHSVGEDPHRKVVIEPKN